VKNKKVIVVCHNYEPDHTPRKPDPENRFFTYGFGGNLGKNIKQYIPGYDIEVWRLDGYTDRYYEGVHLGVKFRVFPSIHKANVVDFSWKFIRELKKEIKITNPILIVNHTHYWVAYQILYFFGSKCKIITTHHGDWSPFFRVHHTRGLRKLKARFDMFVEKRVYKHIDCIMTGEKKQIQYFDMSHPGIDVVFWSTGVNFDYMIPIPKMQARKELGWDQDKKYILYVGKLYKYKQVEEMINTWLEIKKSRPEVELVIVGNTPGDPWEDSSRFAESSGAILEGRKLNKDLYKYYSAADVYVLFSLRDDYFGGTGIAPLESLACNTPVVSNALHNYLGDNVSEIGEIPNSLEEYKEAILKVIDHPENYKNMRESVLNLYSYKALYYKLEVLLKKLEN
jgi:glycosyltransferase involved in cell wall biosynthesis